MSKAKEKNNSSPKIIIKFIMDTKDGKYVPIDDTTLKIGRIQEELELVEDTDYPSYINFA